jgi:hypothetical protein
MKAHPKRTTACPLAAVDQRLADSHRLWHQAEAAYFDPDGFRLAVQNAIQTLRSVTFILQKQKGIIPNFNEWYGDQEKTQRGEWQKRLHADPLMRWMVDARNWIEKEGDLEAHSYVRAEIVASYLDEGPRIEVPAKLFQNPAALLRTIPAGALGEHIRRNGVLRLQRRWVENTLPDYELLDALAIAFGKISELVHDAHRRVGLSPPETIHGDAGESYNLPAMGWRMPCMIARDLPRTLSVALSNGARIEFEEKTISKKITDADVAEFLANLPNDPRMAMAREYNNYNELAAIYFEMIRSVFLRDGYHISVLFLFRQMKLIAQPIQINVENVQQKYLIMRHLANEVTKTGADAAMIVSESWMARAESLKPYERPADSPLRKEALTLLLVSKSGDPIDYMALINRDSDGVSLGETVIVSSPAAFEFAPFYHAWGRPVPASWIETSAAIMSRSKGTP